MTKTALITGATDGIGKATARRFLREGWEVVIVGRNQSRCEATVEELRALHAGQVSALVGDLTLMSEVKRVAEAYLATHNRLDFLMLNANAIVQSRIVTSEGFESNFAIGHLGRALLLQLVNRVLEATPGAQVMTVVGRDTERPNLDDLSLAQGYTAWSALRRWQWCTQVYVGEYSHRSRILANIYMPGLVHTKILADEPQPMRTVVRIANLLFGIPPEKAGENVYAVVADVVSNGATGVTYAWRKRREPLALALQPGDGDRLWNATAELIRPFM